MAQKASLIDDDMSTSRKKDTPEYGRNLRQMMASGKVGIIFGVSLVGIGVLLFCTLVLGASGQSEVAADSSDRWFIDADGKTFEHTIKVGEMPDQILNPASNKRGYAVEWCWWTADGKIREKPYPVLMNTYVGKKGPTYCPDCGRLVVLHNPSPMASENPQSVTPPSKEGQGRH